MSCGILVQQIRYLFLFHVLYFIYIVFIIVLLPSVFYHIRCMTTTWPSCSISTSIYTILFIFLAMGDFQISPCPVGFFCNEAIIKPTSCPSNGTYRNSTGAGSIEECFACPRGYICPFNATVSPIACLNRTYCPPGSVEPRICQPGFYCPRSMYELPCPAGFYCPLGSSYPLKCPLGYYCDPSLSNNRTGGVIKPTLCPKGNVTLK